MGVRSRLAVIACAAVTLTACGAPGPAVASLESVASYTVIPDDPLGPAQQSVTQWDGQTWEFAKPAAGKVTLVYFGYTSCPDVCPTTMADIAAVLRRLPAQTREKVWVQFVSTDPARDTAPRLRNWIQQFDPTFHAARGPIGSVIAAARTYGISIEAPRVTPSNYQVVHGAQVVVLDQHGGEVGFFHELAPIDSFAAAIPALIAKYAS